MKTLIIATIPTHHNSTSLRGLNLEHYNQFGSGVHQSCEDFKTIREAKQHLKDRDLQGVASIQYLTGYDREEYRVHNYLKY